MTDLVDERDPLDELAEEYLARRRRAERPAVSEYVARFPGRTEEVREFLSALQVIEDLKPEGEDTVGPTGWPPGTTAGRPERVGDYRIVREIGRGGMGVVYEAEQESLGRRVALKVLAPHSVLSAEQVGRFLRESRAAAQLHHTNIVPVFGMGEHDRLHYYAMQFIRGTSLDQVLEEIRRLGKAPSSLELRRDEAPTRIGRFDPSSHALGTTTVLVAGSLPTEPPIAADAAADGPVSRDTTRSDRWLSSSGRYSRSVAELGLQVAEALEHAHQHGVLHRDIKPSNLLLDGQRNVWITDFGLAKATEDDDLTRTGDLIGTIRYMAPERFRGRCDARSDVYALGLTLYELLARRPAFDASDRESLVLQVTQSEPPRLRTVEPAVPRDLETIIQKAIEREPTARYETAGAFARDLSRFLEDRPIEARRVTFAERTVRWARRNPVAAALGTTVAVLLTAIAVGSSVAAVRLSRQHAEAVAAGHESKERLWEAYLAQAKAARRGDEAGRRTAALEFVSEASRLGAHSDRRWRLRDEAIACFALADLRKFDAGASSSPSADDLAALDPRVARYAFPGSKGEVVVRSTIDDRQIAVLPAPPLRPVSFQFSPNGKWLAAKCDGSGWIELAVYDIDQGKVTLTAPGLQGNAFDFSPDSRWLAVGRLDGSIDLYDVAGGRFARRFPPGSVPQSLAFDPSGKRLAVASLSPQSALQVRDIDDGAIEHAFALPAGAFISAWHPDGQRLAAGGSDGQVFIVDLERPDKRNETLERHQGAVVSIAFHPDGDLLASGSWDGTLRLWDVRTRQPLVRTASPDAARLHFSRDGRFLGPGKDGQQHWVWEVETGRECQTLVDNDTSIDSTWQIEFPSRHDLLVTTGDRGVRFDTLSTGNDIATLALPGTSSSALMLDDSELLTSGEAGLLRWPIDSKSDSGLRIGPPEAFGLAAGMPTGRMRLAPDGRTMAVVLDWSRGRLAILDLEEPGSRIDVAAHPGLERLAFSPDARWLATGTWRGTGVKIWDARTGRLEADLNVEGSAEVLFSPDGRWLVTGSGDEYRAWDVGTWRKGRGIERVNSGNLPGIMALSSDGRTLALVLSRSVVQLVDPVTFEVLTTLVPPELRVVASLGFSSDGSRLAITHNSRAITLWDLRAVRSELAAIDLDLARPAIPAAGEASARPRSLHIEPPSWTGPVREAEAHAAAGRWAEAAASYAEAFAAGNRSPRDWSRQALLNLVLDRDDEYRAACGGMLAHFEEDPLDVVANIVAWNVALAPEAALDGDFAPFISMARVGAESRQHAGLNTLGAVLYRAGQFEEALATLERSVAAHASGGAPQDWVFLAMCCQRLNRTQEARGWLDRLRTASDSDAPTTTSLSVWDRLELEILTAEADALVNADP